MKQLKLFDLEHEHVFERHLGPHLVSQEIRVGESRWCWTGPCGWVKDGECGNPYED